MWDLGTGGVSTLAGSGQAGQRDGSRLAATFHFPAAVAVAPDGSAVYVADCWSSRLRVITFSGPQGGGVVTLVGGAGDGLLGPQPGAADGPFSAARVAFPRGLAVAGDGKALFVGDTGNNALRVADLKRRTLRTLAGSRLRGRADGAAPLATGHLRGKARLVGQAKAGAAPAEHTRPDESCAHCALTRAAAALGRRRGHSGAAIAAAGAGAVTGRDASIRC